ncbi:probable sec-independent protein translocase protein TATB, chloroplastic at N-terminal half [Coccomyxa sp. Obi]|nr:probable sec-independent protein translocase protein TATB, chloroplastic at N-terminal half [Coccomyxa sp. Obi]
MEQSSQGQVTTCAFLGVGAPEAVLVGVVALIVFGPKGLAEAVKSLGSTLKAFQPTIREIVSVSSDLKNTLEEQIGLDDIRSEIRNSVVPEPRPRPLPEQVESTSEEAALGTTAGELASEMDEDLERKRAAAAAAAWGGQPPVQPIAREETSQYDGEGSQAAAEATTPSLNDLSLADLEAELARRKAAEKARETS